MECCIFPLPCFLGNKLKFLRQTIILCLEKKGDLNRYGTTEQSGNFQHFSYDHLKYFAVDNLLHFRKTANEQMFRYKCNKALGY